MKHKKQKYKKSKKVITGLLSILMIISGFLNTINVKAASTPVVLKKIAGTEANVSKDGHTAWWADGIGKIQVGKKISFCIEPTSTGFSGVYNEEDFSSSLTRTLSTIAYEGWDSSNKTDDDYAVTQFMIWEAMGTSIHFNGSFGNKYNNLKANVQRKISNHNNKPSFNNDKISIDVGKSATITDNNGVLSNFTVKNSGGANVTISGNNLVITPNSSTADNITITLQKIPDSLVGSTIAYRSGTGQDVATFKVSDPIRANIKVKVNKYGSLNITKQDEDGNNVPNTTFKLSKNSDMSSPVGTYTTGGNGSVLINQLLPSTYYLQETAVPSHLVLDNTIRSVTVKPNETASYIARNNWVKGKIAIRKTDTESGKQVAGATYGIFNAQNQELQRLVTTATGYVESGYLRFGSYTVKEVIAPDGYVLNDTKYPVTISSNEQKIDVTGNDVRTKGSIHITKEDSVTGDKPQGQGTSLAGAVYELRARQPILDPADKSVLFAKDAVVATLTTDDQAKASINDLYLGDYYLIGAKRFLISV